MVSAPEDAVNSRKEKENALLRVAREFEKHEEDKQISLFNCIGKENPSAEAVQDVLDAREQIALSEELRKRDQGRQRKEVQRPSERVVVPLGSHPFYSSDSDSKKKYVISAADRVAARKSLLEGFVKTARVVLKVRRVQNRLAKAAANLKGERSSYRLNSEEAPKICLFTFPTPPLSSLHEAEPKEKEAEVEDEPKERQVASIDTFDQVELKEPLHFKQVGYEPHAYPEHGYLMADEDRSLSTFPFGDNEPTTEDIAPLADEYKIEGFQTPSAALHYQFKTQSFTFAPNVRLDLFPYSRPQLEDSAGAQAPFFALDFGEASYLPPTTVTHNSNAQVLFAPLPKPLMKGRDEDQHSDTEDEDAPDAELDTAHPNSLEEVAAIFGEIGDCFLVTGKQEGELVEAKRITTFADETVNTTITIDSIQSMNDAVHASLPQRLSKLF